MKYTLKQLKEKYWEFKKMEHSSQTGNYYWVRNGDGGCGGGYEYIYPDTLEGFLMWLEEK